MAINNSPFGFFSSITTVTKHLLIINVLCWLATFALSKHGIDLYSFFGLHYWKASDFHFYQLITYMFLHSSGLAHIFFNMFALYMFGQMIEHNLGKNFFLFFYFATGIGAGLVQELAWMYDLRPFVAEVNEIINNGVSNGVDVGTKVIYSVDELNQWIHAVYYNSPGLITVGASGAIFGLLVAFAVLFPNVPLYIMFIPIPIKAKYMMIGYAVIELIMGVHGFSWDNVAHFAHLGGALVGAILIFYWKKSRINF